MKIRISIFDRLIHFIVLMSLLSISTLVRAQTDGGWDYFIGGYFTAVNIDAKTTSFTPAGDQEMKIDPSFSDLLDNLDYGASGIFIARKGRYSFNVDLLAAGLSIDESLPTPLSEVNIDIDIREYEFYVGYAAFEQYPDLEIIAGVRYIDQDIEVDIKTPGPQPSFSIGDDWVDPFIGLRYDGPINANWNWLLRGDIGGFDMGGSDFAWRVDAGTSYRFAKQWEAAIWYHILDIDYESGTSGTPSIYKWDGQESGITFGVGYHF